MSTITKRVTVGRDHRIHFDLDAPAGFPEGEAEAVVDLKPVTPEKKPQNRIREIYGKGKNKSWMADDFNAPLDDFAEYM